MTIPRSLGECVSWVRFFQLIGAELKFRVLPTVVDCPLCSGIRLYLYKDNRIGGEWHHCRDCGSRGDIIDLASKFWKVNAVEAIVRLTDGEVDSTAAVSHATRIEAYSAFSSFVRNGYDNPPPLLSGVLKSAGFAKPVATERWQKGIGRFCLASKHSELLEALRYNLIDNTRGPDRGGPRLLFRPAGWDSVLVVPFYDMPGRESGVWVLGKDFEVGSDIFYGLDRELPDPGFGMLDAAWDCPVTGEFANTLFIINDVRTALRLHERHFQLHTTPLPVLACAGLERRTRAYDNDLFGGRKVIYWTDEITVEVLRHVKDANGRVACLGPIIGRYDDYQFPEKWLDHVREVSVHWTVAADKLLARLPDIEFESVLKKLSLNDGDRESLRSQCSPSTRARWDRLAGCLVTRSIGIDSFQVFERNGAWFAKGSNKSEFRVSNFVYRIEKVLQFGEGPSAYYQGSVFFEGETYPFCEEKNAFERNPFEYIRNLIFQKAMKNVKFTPRWSSRSTQIAFEFHEPSCERGNDRCGWIEESGAWVFSKFAIDARGDVTDEGFIGRSVRNVPTRDIEKPNLLHVEDVEMLSARDELTNLFWGFFACLTSNLAAPAVDHGTAGIALIGSDTAALVRPLAAGAGCLEHVLRTVHRYPVPDERLEFEHGWPVVFFKPGDSRASEFDRWITRPGSRNALLELNWYAACLASFQGDWHWLEASHPPTGMSKFKRVSGQIVPNFLKWFGTRRMELPTRSTFGASILVAMGQWFEEMGGRPDAVAGASKTVTFCPEGRAENTSERFGDLLCRLVEDGITEIDARLDRRTLATVNGNNLSVSPKRLNRILVGMRCPPIDVDAVADTLSRAGILLGEIEVSLGKESDTGWELDGEWWGRKRRSWKRIHNRSFKIVG